jgi:exosortase A
MGKSLFGRSPEWAFASLAFSAAVIGNFVVYAETWRSLILTWVTIETYYYGLLVPLASAVLVWRVRGALLQLVPQPALSGVVAVGICIVAWVLGELSTVQVIKQAAVIGLIQATALAIFGNAILRLLVFPCLYLFLAVPVGEFLLPTLISWTAGVSVAMLELLGVPVYLDGPFIRIPEGDFHVVKACSGIRYLLSSVTLGAVFAYLGFRSNIRRLLFMGVCVIVPVVANWIRATLIIMIGHWSEMQYAAGIDHLVYGWLFFGIVMWIVFLIGSRFSDAEIAMQGSAVPSLPRRQSNRNGLWITSTAALIILALPAGEAASGIMRARHAIDVAESAAAAALPDGVSGWIRTHDAQDNWRFVSNGARRVIRADYEKDMTTVSVLAVIYGIERQDAELVAETNSVYDPLAWWPLSTGIRRIEVGREPISVREVIVSNASEQRLIWWWYRIDGHETSSRIWAKLLTLRSVFGTVADGVSAQLAVAVVADDIELARESLRSYLVDYLPSVRSCLSAATASERECGSEH